MRARPVVASLAIIASAMIATTAFGQGAGWYYNMMQECARAGGSWSCATGGAYCHCARSVPAVRPAQPQPQPAPVQPRQNTLKSSPPIVFPQGWAGPYGTSAERQRKYNAAMNAGKAAYDRKDYDAALRFYRQAQAILNTADARFAITASKAAPARDKGAAAYAAGDYESAIRHYQEAVNLAPDFAPYRASLAHAHAAAAHKRAMAAFKKGDYRSAIREWTDATTWDPGFEPYRHDLAVAKASLADEERKAAAPAAPKPSGAFAPPVPSIGTAHVDVGGDGIALSHDLPPVRSYIASGNGLVAGTGWTAGFYAPKDASPAVKAKEREMLKRLSTLAGRPEDAAVDFKRYDFVVGLAADTNAFRDLYKRVWFDELESGKATTGTQAGYDLLRGRSFGELACHSNGAMICLAALENADVKADRVVLYGPQMTAESLRMWQHLIETNQIRSVQVYLNQNDLVPWASVVAGGDVIPSIVVKEPDRMKKIIQALAPSVGVKTFPCASAPLTFDCHELVVYKGDRNSPEGSR